MRFIRRFLVCGALILSAALLPSCWFDSAQTLDLEVSLFSGVDTIVRLDDTESDTMSRTPERCESEPIAVDSPLAELKFTQLCEYKSLGIKAYYRFGRVALLELQEPFHGVVKGKNLRLFGLTRVAGKTWRDTLIQRFGAPGAESQGGRLSSQGLFYYWGDIAFNGQGPNQLALYRDQTIRTYRGQNFGRVLDLGFH